jgi:biotin carboxyl carrier protein
MLFEASVAGRSVRVEVQARDGGYRVLLDGRAFDVDVDETRPELVSLLVDGRSHELGLAREGDTYVVASREGSLRVRLTEGAVAVPARRADAAPAHITAPMPGKIVRLLRGVGEPVTAGEGLVVMEAMKMENELRSPRAGTLREIRVSEGQAVETGALLAVVD